MKLIINADDFGYSTGQNLGIIEGYKNGGITATTLLMTTPGTIEAIELAKENPGLDIGIHLTLDLGKPVLDTKEIPSLIQENGIFKTYNLTKSYILHNEAEIYNEWKAQIELAMMHGIKPTHIDSHHHIHMFPGLFEIYVQLAKEYNVAIRFHTRRLSPIQESEYRKLIKHIPHADVFTSGFFEDNATLEFFTNLPKTRQTYEMMCHPAFVDYTILKNSSYNTMRAKELQVLQSKVLVQILREKNIQLISFKDLCR